MGTRIMESVWTGTKAVSTSCYWLLRWHGSREAPLKVVGLWLISGALGEVSSWLWPVGSPTVLSRTGDNWSHGGNRVPGLPLSL